MSDTYTLDNRVEEHINPSEREAYMKQYFNALHLKVVDYRHLQCWGMFVVTSDGSVYKVTAEDRNTMRIEDTYAQISRVHCPETVNKVLDAYVTIDRVQRGLDLH